MPLYLPKVSSLRFVAFYCSWYWVDVLLASGIIIPHELLRFLFFTSRNFDHHLEARCWSNIGQISRENIFQCIHQLSRTCSLNPHLSSTSFAYLFPFLGYSLKPGLDFGLCVPNLNWFLSTRNALISWQISFHKTSLNKISFSHTNCLLSLLNI